MNWVEKAQNLVKEVVHSKERAGFDENVELILKFHSSKLISGKLILEGQKKRAYAFLEGKVDISSKEQIRELKKSEIIFVHFELMKKIKNQVKKELRRKRVIVFNEISEEELQNHLLTREINNKGHLQVPLGLISLGEQNLNSNLNSVASFLNENSFKPIRIGVKRTMGPLIKANAF